jgi:hypothetical protein
MRNQVKKDAAIITNDVTDLSGEEGEGQDFTVLSLLSAVPDTIGNSHPQNKVRQTQCWRTLGK